MHALYQRLKELDPDTFEKLCLHLLRARHPGADIEHVEGSAGDEGVDLFLGELDRGPIVWQCKSFPNGVGKSQKEQIRSSLNRVIEKVSPKRWVLCLSVDMDVKSSRWFQRLARSKADRVEVGLMQANNIVDQLLYRRTIREDFFPGAAIDTVLLREALLKTGDLTLDELTSVTDENMHAYIDRLKEQDARFDYRITFRGDGPPSTTGDSVGPRSIVSLSDGNKVIDVIPRDLEALRSDPPKGKLKLSGVGAKKLNEFLCTGHEQELGPSDALGFSTNLPFIPKDGTDIQSLLLRTTPSDPHPFRVTFGAGESRVVYDLINFRAIRAGSEETELASEEGFPFVLKLIIKTDGTGSMDLQERCVGKDVREVQKYMRAAKQMINDGNLELYSLRASRNLFQATMDSSLPAEWTEFLGPLVDDAASVAERYGVDLTIPDFFRHKDIAALAFLKALPTGCPIPKRRVTVNITKIPDSRAILQYFLTPDTWVISPLPEQLRPPVVFGTPVPTGPVEMVGRATAIRPEEFRARFEQARVGDVVPLVMEATGLFEVRLQSVC